MSDGAYRENPLALRDENARLRAENARLHAENAELTGRIAWLHGLVDRAGAAAGEQTSGGCFGLLALALLAAWLAPCFARC